MKRKNDLYGNPLEKGEKQKRDKTYVFLCSRGGVRYGTTAKTLEELREKRSSVQARAFMKSYRFHLIFWKMKYIFRSQVIPIDEIKKTAKKYDISVNHIW